MKKIIKESLHYICYHGKDEELLERINQNESLHEIDIYGFCPIHYSIINDKLSTFKILVENGCKNDKTCFGLTCIHVAIYFDKFNFIPELIDQKDSVENSNETPTIYAASFGRNDSLMYLIRKGADISKKNLQGNNALHFAIMNGNVIGASELIRNGLNMFEKNKNGVLPFSNLQFKLKKEEVKNNIVKIYDNMSNHLNEELMKSVQTDVVIKSKTGEIHHVHNVVVSCFDLYDGKLSDGALNIYIEWMYSRKSEIMEQQNAETCINEILELMEIETINRYIAVYLVKQKALFPLQLLKAFSNVEMRNRNANIGRYIIMHVFENFVEYIPLLKKMDKEEIAHLVEALPLEQREMTVAAQEPKQYTEVKMQSENDLKTFPMSQMNLRLCSKMLTSLITNKQNIIQSFVNPVNEKRDRAFDYHKIIKKPMCISEVKRKLYNDKYQTCNDFMKDIRLIWSNAKTYNQQGTILYIYADELSAEAEKLWNDLPLNDEDEQKLMKKVQQERKKEKDSENESEMIQMEKRRFDSIENNSNVKTENKNEKHSKVVKHYEYADLEKLMEKLRQLSENDLKDIPTILGVKTETDEFDLDLEQMDDNQLYKVEVYCDSILN